MDALSQVSCKLSRDQGSKKNCPCVEWTGVVKDSFYDKDAWDQQQQILADLEKELNGADPPLCVLMKGLARRNFDGSPNPGPSAWCECTGDASGDQATSTVGAFATLADGADQACAYTSMPTSTLVFPTNVPTSVAITSCRWETM